MDENNLEGEWTQQEVIHCKDGICHGMLLQNDYYDMHKCSDCERYWTRHIEWTEVKTSKNDQNRKEEKGK